MFPTGIGDLKSERRAAMVKEANEKVASGERQGKQKQAEQLTATGYAMETFTFMANCCKGPHTGMQDYIHEQPGHQERYDLISDIIHYIKSLERDVKADIRSHTARLREEEKMQSHSMENGGSYGNDNKSTHYVSSSIDRLFASFHLLEYLARYECSRTLPWLAC